MSWSLVVMTLLEALKPVLALIMLMNSCEMSTLLCSNEPERICPASKVEGAVMTAVPLLAAAE